MPNDAVYRPGLPRGATAGLPEGSEYFNPDCKHSSLCDILVEAHLSNSSGELKNNPIILHWPIETRLNDLKEISDEEATATVRLIERCLHLDPAHRSTAAELLSDHWFDGVG